MDQLNREGRGGESVLGRENSKSKSSGGREHGVIEELKEGQHAL